MKIVVNIIVILVVYFVTAYLNKKFNNIGYVETGMVYFLTMLVLYLLLFYFENQYV